MKSSSKISRVLFAGLLVLLFIPLLQFQFSLFEVKPLHGSIKKIDKPKFTYANWFNEDYQTQVEKYLNQNFGFRNWFVRLNNQIQFSFFKIAKANGVIIGDQNYLYEKSYISAYFGQDFLGEDVIDDQLEKLTFIQDELGKRGIDILLVVAPSKASFYPEFIPEKFDTIPGISNYEYFVERMPLLGINHIDFSSLFIQAKDTSRYCLYPKTGIHWSYYGMNYATDSIVRYIEDLREIDMPDMLWERIEVKKTLFGVDTDIEKGMNLLWPLSNFEMPYPKIKVDQNNKTKPKTIVIADSFYWQIFNSGYSKSIFDGEFWFYNNAIYPKRNDGKSNVSKVNLYEEITQRDVIILLCTEPVLKRKFWGFIDNAYSTFLNKTNYEEEVQKLISEIRGNEEWLQKVIIKANAKNITTEEMLRLDATFIIAQRESNTSSR